MNQSRGLNIMMTRASSFLSSTFRKHLLKPPSHPRLSQTLAQRIRDLPNSEPATSRRPSLTIDRDNLDEVCSLPAAPLLNRRKNPLIENLDHLIYRDLQKSKLDNLDTALETTKKRLSTTLNPITKQRLQARIQELETLKSELTSNKTLNVMGFIGWTNQKPDQTSKEHRFSQYDAVLLKIGTQYSVRILKSSGLIHGNYSQTKELLKKLIPEKDHHFQFHTPEPNQTLTTKITINLENQPSDVSSIQNYLQALNTTLNHSYKSGTDYYLKDLFELKKQLLEELEKNVEEKNRILFQENLLLFLDIWLWRHSNVEFIGFETTLKDKLKSIPKEQYSTLISIASNDPSQSGIKTEDTKVRVLNDLIKDHP